MDNEITQGVAENTLAKETEPLKKEMTGKVPNFLHV